MKGDVSIPLDSTEAIRKTKDLVESGSDTQQEDTYRQLLTMFKENSEVLQEIKEGTVRIEAKVDSLAEQVRGLSSQIENYQSLVQRQLEMASSPEEIEHIIHAYIDECASKVTRFIDSSYSSQIYKEESERLILSFGEAAWSKLDDSSKTFLISAKVIFNKLSGISDLVDYSGVCLLVTKALEVEVSNRFGKEFLSYLKTKYPGKSNHNQFPTPLLDKFGHPLKAKHFTLGTVAYVLCFKKDSELTEEQDVNNRTKLLQFTKEVLMPGKTEEQIFDLLQEYAEEVERVREDYRNPSAHTNELTRIEAKECFDLVVDVEKLLKRMLDSFVK